MVKLTHLEDLLRCLSVSFFILVPDVVNDKKCIVAPESSKPETILVVSLGLEVVLPHVGLQQYPIGSNFLPDLDIMGFADRGVNAPPPPVFGFPWSQAISRWASESCFVIDAICVVSSEIVLDMRLTDSRSAFVAVAKFARATLWSCCISVNISAQDSTLCRCAE